MKSSILSLTVLTQLIYNVYTEPNVTKPEESDELTQELNSYVFYDPKETSTTTETPDKLDRTLQGLLVKPERSYVYKLDRPTTLIINTSSTTPKPSDSYLEMVGGEDTTTHITKPTTDEKEVQGVLNSSDRELSGKNAYHPSVERVVIHPNHEHSQTTIIEYIDEVEEPASTTPVPKKTKHPAIIIGGAAITYTEKNEPSDNPARIHTIHPPYVEIPEYKNYHPAPIFIGKTDYQYSKGKQMHHGKHAQPQQPPKPISKPEPQPAPQPNKKEPSIMSIFDYLKPILEMNS